MSVEEGCYSGNYGMAGLKRDCRYSIAKIESLKCFAFNLNKKLSVSLFGLLVNCHLSEFISSIDLVESNCYL